MTPPSRWLWLCAVCVCWSCPVLAQDPAAQARQFWLRGQEAMRQGKPDEGVQWYELSLTADPSKKRGHLILAAAYIERCDEAGATRHLEQYVAAFPEQHAA